MILYQEAKGKEDFLQTRDEEAGRMSRRKVTNLQTDEEAFDLPDPDDKDRPIVRSSFFIS